MFFFFSSRRRHTRSLRDWSSDVCSSDLVGPLLERGMAARDPWVRAMSRMLSGYLLSNEGDQDGAETALAAALEQFREVGDRFGGAMATSGLGWARAVRGNNAGAAAVLREALGMLGELGAVEDTAE